MKAESASQILFGGKADPEALKALDEQTFLSVFEGVPQFEIAKAQLSDNILDVLAVHSAVFPSKGECRKMIQAGGLSINKEKCNSLDKTLAETDLVHDQYVLIQKGKKNYYLLKFV